MIAVGRIAVVQIFALTVARLAVVVAQPTASAAVAVVAATSSADHGQTCSCAACGLTCSS